MIKSKALLTRGKVDLAKGVKEKMLDRAFIRMRELSSTAANFQLAQGELPKIGYQIRMQKEGIQGGRAFLEELESGAAGFPKGIMKEEWIKAEKAWLTYSFIEDMT